VSATEIILLPQKAWEQVQENSTAILGTLGNFFLIIGKPKSRKSFFISIAVSTVLKSDLLLNQFRGCLTHDKRKVIYFDTEQSEYHVQLALRRICKQIEADIPEDLKEYHLRSKNPLERLKIIEYAIYNTPNLGFVVIDGIKDLVNSINDEAEATMIASKLLKWTEDLNIHIVTVLHQNKSDKNARGHIGTELINKAETVLSVTKNEKDNDISIVEAQMCRNIEPNPFAFEINEEGLPVLVENFEIRTETRNNKFDILDLEDHKKFKLLDEVFNKDVSFSYSNLLIQLKLAYKNQLNNKIGDNRCKELIGYCKNKNWLIQEKTKAPYFLGQFKDTTLK
jgi:predicted ATP-dependent serine protease